MMENLPNFVKLLLSGALAGLKQEAFMNRTVKEIMWGYEDPLIEAINVIVPGLIPFKGKFGILLQVSRLLLGNTKIIAVLVLGLLVWVCLGSVGLGYPPHTREQPSVASGGCVRLP